MLGTQPLDRDSDAPEASYFNRMRELLSCYSASERRTLAHIKRFLECIYGDDEFLEALRADKSALGVRRLALQRGADVDPLALASIWDRPDPLPIKPSEMGDSELTRFWVEWVTRAEGFGELHRDSGNTDVDFPRFHKWRQRQIQRCLTEVGFHAAKIAHPIFAFELSNGCSVGCTFCGVGADKLRANFRRTPENALLWRSVLEAGCRRFGPAMRTGFCYWATEPMDNPDYLDLVEDFRQVTGELPQTTTIEPLRNVERTRKLLELHRRHEAIQNRFSIQSLEMLRDVHATFTPEELANVRLLLYHQNNQLKRTKAGKAYVTGSEHDEAWDGGTIACVSGFLVNMCTRTIRLISPCPASDEWRNGYRVYYSGTFASGEEFEARIAEAAELCMPEALPDDEVVAFRADLTLKDVDDGISLKSRYRETLFTGKPFLREMGRLIGTGALRGRDVSGRLIEDGSDFLDVFATMHALFEGGFLDESNTVGHTASGG